MCVAEEKELMQHGERDPKNLGDIPDLLRQLVVKWSSTSGYSPGL
jgi:hypothetical protein